jgi:methyl-accepting chemotaxis protein
MSILNNLPIKTRLYILVGLLIGIAVGIGLLGLNGMKSADQAIDELYHKDMARMDALSTTLEKLEDSRAQVLLSLQHDPTSPFAKMHDHPLSMHFDRIEKNLKMIDSHWEEYESSDLSAEEKRLAGDFTPELRKFESQGIEPIREKIHTNEFVEANKLVLTVLNPSLSKLQEVANALLKIQEQVAATAYEETDTAYHSMITLVVSSLVLGASAGLLLAYLTIREISSGVQAVEQTAQRLAEGDLAARVDYRNKDELGRIANAFNRMAQRFHDAINQVKDSVTQLAAASEETSTVTAQTTTGINQQLNETSQVATAINEMNATVQEVAKNAVVAAEAAKEADATFDEGKLVIDRIIGSICELASEVGTAAEVIQELEQESRNIGSVLDVIKSIAEQTNLLALNAAIEAARAGEQGRGFAVVADEVRTLAGRTQESTQEIEEMISKLQSGADNAVKVMNSGKDKTQVGVDQAAKAGDAMQKINAAVNRISEMNTQIAGAAEEQSTVTDEINRSIISIHEVAEQSAAGAQHTTQASHDMARLAEQLKEMVERFKV